MRKRIFTDQESNQIIKKYKLGYSATKIANEFGVVCDTILKHLRANGFDICPKILSEKDKIKIIELYNQGIGTTTIGKKLGFSDVSIGKFLKKNNIKIRNSYDYRKYHFNENFFEEINDEKTAYCLGLWYTDGSNDEKRNRNILDLTDLDLIEKTKKILNFDGPIHITLPKKPHHKTSYRLLLISKNFSEDLARLGCVQRKTYCLKFPKNISEKLMPHFIRGLFDGDGSIFPIKKGRGISIVGTKSICEGLKNWFNYGNFYLKSKNKKTGHESYDWTFSAKSNVIAFLSYIYKDATIYMNRKFNKYQEFFRSLL